MPVTDEDIAAAHPLETGRHDLYQEAMRLVGARHEKGDLVDLTTCLLLRAADADARVVELEATLRNRDANIRDLQAQLTQAATASVCTVADKISKGGTSMRAVGEKPSPGEVRRHCVPGIRPVEEPSEAGKDVSTESHGGSEPDSNTLADRALIKSATALRPSDARAVGGGGGASVDDVLPPVLVSTTVLPQRQNDARSPYRSVPEESKERAFWRGAEWAFVHSDPSRVAHAIADASVAAKQRPNEALPLSPPVDMVRSLAGWLKHMQPCPECGDGIEQIAHVSYPMKHDQDCDVGQTIERARSWVAETRTDYALRDPESEIRATLKHWSDVDPTVQGLRASHVGELAALFRTMARTETPLPGEERIQSFIHTWAETSGDDAYMRRDLLALLGVQDEKKEAGDD